MEKYESWLRSPVHLRMDGKSLNLVVHVFSFFSRADTCAQFDDREVFYSENGAFATTSAKLRDVYPSTHRTPKSGTMLSKVKANLFVNTWQGAIVVARAGEGLEHIGRVFSYLKEIVSLSCKSENVGLSRDSRRSLIYSENGAPATRSAKFGGVNPSTYRMPKSRRMLSTAVIGF
jgi:hypothetical protein